MRKLLPTGLLGLIGLVTIGLLTLQAPTVSAGLAESSTPEPGSSAANDDVVKREDDAVELVLVDDDDDDDSRDTRDTRTRSRFTGHSRSTRDHTRSNFTKVSRDRDLSRGDKTRDWTKDGPGKKKRDWSANTTNDRSRNDTRR